MTLMLQNSTFKRYTKICVILIHIFLYILKIIYNIQLHILSIFIYFKQNFDSMS